ncbi:MAG TPA: formate dehydrogenase accessory protein FdhE [Burkholderiaceae bacterium]|nr:formate dehydrogenase accessory protein FdhE [Burkholderiaceae bacterium]
MTTIRISTPEEIAAGAGEDAPFLRFPERSSCFAEREMRLRQLAAGHAMRDFLIFVADIAQAQQRELMQAHDGALPDAEELRRAADAGVAPLPAADWPRPAAWRDVLRRMVRALRERVTAGPAADTLARIVAASDAELEQQAERLLHGVMLGLDLAWAPLIGAALQVLWTDLVLRTQARAAAEGSSAFGRVADAGSCPACGSRPTASVVRIDGGHSGLRYLHCSLCSLQWHRVRIECTHCGRNEKIHYQSLQAQAGVATNPTGAVEGTVRAECCDDCGHYLKVVQMDKDAHAEPVADDLASLTLDLLVSETGLQRHGVNLMLLFGDPDATPPPGAP